MSLTDILNSVTIVNDCSSWYVSLYVAAVLVGIVSLLGVTAIILKIVRGSFVHEISGSILLIIGTTITAIVSIFAMWGFITYPINIQMYIAANDVSVTELSTYFELENISSTDENVFLSINPKLEYYDEMLEWYKQNNG